MILRVDPRAEEAPFAQLRRQITDQVKSGALAPGDQLPTVRRLAGDLGIAPNTVARAYRELEADGLLQGRGRAGTFVAGSADPADGTASPPAARRAAEEYARTARSLGLSPAEALALARTALRA